MSPASFLRRLVRGRDSNRPAPRPGRFAPQLTLLEGRDVPSGSQPVPFKETLTLVDASETGVLSYVGKATQFGKLTATLDTTTNLFTKTAANGDTAFGFVTHASETTGSITIVGGTGRFAGVAADSTYVISVDAAGTTTVAVTGTITNGTPKGRSGDTVTVPFRLTGGGPAPSGLPLFPGGTAAHTSTGTATHLGRHTGSGEFKLGSLDISPTGAVTGTFSGTYTFVAANGDRLVMTYGAGGTGVLTGQASADGLSVQNVAFDAVFTPDPAASTGRFAGATGGFRMLASADSISLVSSVPGYTAPFNYAWTGDGVLVLVKGA